jgi:hypothetical protein
VIEGIIISKDVIGSLSKQYEDQIMELQTAELTIKIDKANTSLMIRGNPADVQQQKVVIENLLKEQQKVIADQKAKTNDPEYIKQTQGILAYLKHLGSQQDSRYPDYFKTYCGKIGAETGEAKQQWLSPTNPLYREVERLVMETWEAGKVGHGQDARHLKHNQIEVKNISVIENPTLFRKYCNQKKEMCFKAASSPFPAICGQNGEGEVVTRLTGLKLLDKNIVKEINEVYLFHGTKKANTSAIEANGLDSRLTSDDAMFGRGVYLAERSTKADQYADEKTSRVGTHQSLYMYVTRVLLGHAYICTTPKEFKRPPCTASGCNSDLCKNTGHLGSVHDSVIGVARNDGTRLLFREFIIYEPAQSYPEFRVEYERL